MSLIRTLGIVVPALALLLQACAGGSETGTGLTVGKDVSVGTITKFGSVWVNGVEFETGKTQVKLEGAGSTYSALKLGMVVTVKGTINADGVSGSADQILAEEVIKGPVTATPASGANSFTVLGQEVLVNETTLYEPGLTLGALVKDDLVEVSGVVKSTGVSAGVIIATRVERKLSLSSYKLKGYVSNINAMASTFSIGTLLTVNYKGAAGLPNDVPADGLLVEVKGSLVGSVLMAISLEAEKLDVEDADKFEIEGYVGAVSSSGTSISFTVNNVAVQTTATTEFSAGLGTDLVPGVFVEIEGKLQGGVVSASHVEFREGVTLESLVATKTTTTLTLTGLGDLSVVVGSETEFEGVPDIGGIDLSNAQGAHRVTVRGRYAGSKKVIATRIKAKVNEVSSEQKVVLQGPVDGFANTTLTVMGIDIVTSSTMSFDNNGAVNQNSFFAAVTAGDIVNIEGTLSSGTATWTDIELEN